MHSCPTLGREFGRNLRWPQELDSVSLSLQHISELQMTHRRSWPLVMLTFLKLFERASNPTNLRRPKLRDAIASLNPVRSLVRLFARVPNIKIGSALTSQLMRTRSNLPRRRPNGSFRSAGRPAGSLQSDSCPLPGRMKPTLIYPFESSICGLIGRHKQCNQRDNLYQTACCFSECASRRAS